MHAHAALWKENSRRRGAGLALGLDAVGALHAGVSSPDFERESAIDQMQPFAPFDVDESRIHLVDR